MKLGISSGARKISFIKVVASGNDFVIIDASHAFAGAGNSQVASHKSFVKRICDRKYGVGADGVLVLERSKKADLKMRIFNADETEADMCGNGARSAALYAIRTRHFTRNPPKIVREKISLETRAGIIEAQVLGDNVKIKLTAASNYKEDIVLKINNRNLKVNFINTGVPHVVVFVERAEVIDVQGLGRLIRNNKKFSPRGANVNFVEIVGKDSIKVRTYERGVEGETLACGTGSVASVLLSAIRFSMGTNQLKVITRGGEVLKVYFNRVGKKIDNVWLEGKAGIVYGGDYYV